MPKSSRALASLTPPELNGILQRLALFEPPTTIARGYKFPISVVEQIARQHQTEIRALRNSWEKWINRVEPLTNRSNAIVFLGNLARRAAHEGAYTQAAKIWETLDKVYRESAQSTVQDAMIMDMLQRADFEHARRMATEAEVTDAERLLPEPSFAEYLDNSEAAEIEAAANFEDAEDGIPNLEDDPNEADKPTRNRNRTLENESSDRTDDHGQHESVAPRRRRKR